jgi:hypothetical protein
MLTEPVLEGLLEVVGGATTADTLTDFLDAAPLILPAAGSASQSATSWPRSCGGATARARHRGARSAVPPARQRTLGEGPLRHGLRHRGVTRGGERERAVRTDPQLAAVCDWGGRGAAWARVILAAAAAASASPPLL